MWQQYRCNQGRHIIETRRGQVEVSYLANSITVVLSRFLGHIHISVIVARDDSNTAMGIQIDTELLLPRKAIIGLYAWTILKAAETPHVGAEIHTTPAMLLRLQTYYQA